ncbi:MAG: nucleotide sugar dehydrogenase [Opitutales bacterium]
MLLPLQQLRVCVIGLGYVGLLAAAILAAGGVRVRGVDAKASVRETVGDGRVHIVGPDLDMLVRAGVQTEALTVAAEPAPSDVFIICVPTPLTSEKRPDLSMLLAASETLAPYSEPGNLVVVESTIPPGTTEQVRDILLAGSGLPREELRVVHAPERVLPGSILREVIENSRIVGGVDAASTEAGVTFYRQFVTGEILACDARTAETAKLAENAFRDVNIAFANELSLICDQLGVAVKDVVGLANHHPRVNILKPGPGVGGHCIAVDPYLLIDQAPGVSPLLQTARSVNLRKTQWVVERVRKVAAEMGARTIACLGLAYKPNTDDLRESPALTITRNLHATEGLEILAVEPHLDDIEELTLVPLDEALARADLIVGLVAHRVFRAIEPAALSRCRWVDFADAFPSVPAS